MTDRDPEDPVEPTEAERLAEELREFAYIVSHDLSEPVRSVVGFAKLVERRRAELADEGRPVDDEKLNQYLDHMVGGAARMQSLLDDLLLYSRAQRAELAPEPLTLIDVVNAARVTAPKDLSVEVPTPQAGVWADRTTLVQAVAAILDNAAKYTAGPARALVTSETDAAESTITIADAGIGLPTDAGPRAIEVFGRLHAREEYPGNGMGLAIASKIIEKHHGTIEVVDPPAGWSTAIEIRLPHKRDSDGRTA